MKRLFYIRDSRAFIVLAISLLAGLVLNDFLHRGARPKDLSGLHLSPIVRLVGKDGKTFCTGSVVNDTTIITAGHCLLGYSFLGRTRVETEKIEIRPVDNAKLDLYGAATYVTTQMDQGLVKGDFRAFDKINFITDPLKIQTIKNTLPILVACGYPLYGNLFCSLMQYKEQEEFQWVTVGGVLIPGMSGGPVMTEDGTMLAVNSAVEGSAALVTPIYNLSEMFDFKPQQ